MLVVDEDLPCKCYVQWIQQSRPPRRSPSTTEICDSY